MSGPQPPITIPNILNWKPDQLTTAAKSVGTLYQNLDTAVKTAVDGIHGIGAQGKWSGAAAGAAASRMQLEQSRASTVSQAVMELQNSINQQVGNLINVRDTVKSLKEAAEKPLMAGAPTLKVKDDGSVDATDLLNWMRTAKDANGKPLIDSDGPEVKHLIDAAKQAMLQEIAIKRAMGQAHDVATSATSAVTQAKAKVEDAHNGLDAPAPGASSPAHTAPQAASGGHSTPSAQTVSYHPNGHASSSMSHGGSYSGGSGSSGGESSGTPADYHPRPITGNKAEWIAQAREILIGMGYPPEAIDDDAISIIIDGESGGNPNAINGSDSNAAAGHPSMGLMQTIQSTFDAHAAPGHTDIMNPVDNIVAATRYSMDRYGGLDNVPGVQAVRHGGSYVGY